MTASGVKLFPNRIAELTSETGIVGRFVAHYTQDVVVRAAINAPHETGRLARSIGVLKAEHGPSSISIKVGSNVVNPRNDFAYARAQHTGARGRKASNPGTPMKFKPRRSNRWVVTLKVGPIPSDPYLTDALKEANVAQPSGQKFTIKLNLEKRG